MKESELKSWMTAEQRKEWNHARKTGGSTQLELGRPDCGSDGIWIPSMHEGARYADGTRENYWSAEWTGVYFDVCEGVPYVFDWTCDTDGNHDSDGRCPLDEYTDEVALTDVLNAAQAYQGCMQHVADTGEDPLGEILVKAERTVRERWTYEFKKSSLGLRLTRAKHGRSPWLHPRDLPKHAVDYASVDDKFCTTWDPADVKLTRAGRVSAVLEVRKPRNPLIVAREVRKAARRRLNHKEA